MYPRETQLKFQKAEVWDNSRYRRWWFCRRVNLKHRKKLVANATDSIISLEYKRMCHTKQWSFACKGFKNEQITWRWMIGSMKASNATSTSASRKAWKLWHLILRWVYWLHQGIEQSRFIIHRIENGYSTLWSRKDEDAQELLNWGFNNNIHSRKHRGKTKPLLCCWTHFGSCATHIVDWLDTVPMQKLRRCYCLNVEDGLQANSSTFYHHQLWVDQNEICRSCHQW